MSKTYEELANLDRLVHEPARLAILTVLAACAGTDFLFLKQAIGLTGGNLNTHLTALETAGLIVVTKRFEGKVPHTAVSLSTVGRRAIDEHWGQLAALRRKARSTEMRAQLRSQLPAPSKG
jgi:DNA-binding transcriptional ArsR family regulator